MVGWPRDSQRKTSYETSLRAGASREGMGKRVLEGGIGKGKERGGERNKEGERERVGNGYAMS